MGEQANYHCCVSELNGVCWASWLATIGKEGAAAAQHHQPIHTLDDVQECANY